jgi:hypothetical protein
MATESSAAAASRMLRPANSGPASAPTLASASGSAGSASALTIGFEQESIVKGHGCSPRSRNRNEHLFSYTLIFFSIQHIILCTLSVFLPSSFQSA